MNARERENNGHYNVHLCGSHCLVYQKTSRGLSGCEPIEGKFKLALHHASCVSSSRVTSVDGPG